MYRYYDCKIDTQVVDVETNVDYMGEEEFLKLGTNLTFTLNMLSDTDMDYFISGMKKLIDDREIYRENEILKEKVNDLNDRICVLENAHKIRTNLEISKIRNSIDI